MSNVPSFVGVHVTTTDLPAARSATLKSVPDATTSWVVVPLFVTLTMTGLPTTSASMPVALRYMLPGPAEAGAPGAAGVSPSSMVAVIIVMLVDEPIVVLFVPALLGALSLLTQPPIMAALSRRRGRMRRIARRMLASGEKGSCGSVGHPRGLSRERPFVPP